VKPKATAFSVHLDFARLPQYNGRMIDRGNNVTRWWWQPNN